MFFSMIRSKNVLSDQNLAGVRDSVLLYLPNPNRETMVTFSRQCTSFTNQEEMSSHLCSVMKIA